MPVSIDWDTRRINAAMAFILARLDADFATTVLPMIELRIIPAWSSGGSEDDNAKQDPRPDDVIVVCGGHEFSLPLTAGVETACAEAADALQDDVIGSTGRPWPEINTREGAYVGVLFPRVEAPQQVALWYLNGQSLCAVGHLYPACAAAGLTIA
ncbi:MAG: hypothetical protein ACT4NY_02425 [Pseudonocardiales bacterium]